MKLLVLEPAGPFAERLGELFLGFVLVCTIVWILVVLTLFVAAHRRQARDDVPTPHPDPAGERPLLRSVGIAAALTVVIIVGLNVASFATDHALTQDSRDVSLTIEVTGHQWWWEVTYEHAEPHQTLKTANEIHIPVGERVRLRLESADVIHSFWVPELHGKADLIPGRDNQLVLQADRPGEYAGQCAEFCGYQHAHMRLKVIAHTAEAFERWRRAQLQPAATPHEPGRRRGLDVFLAQPCVMCHTIRGTPARGRMAPDLTHLASRTTIGAGTLALTRGNLAAWISDPQGVKPGAHMPSMQIPAEDLHPLLDYLEGLK